MGTPPLEVWVVWGCHGMPYRKENIPGPSRGVLSGVPDSSGLGLPLVTALKVMVCKPLTGPKNSARLMIPRDQCKSAVGGALQSHI